MRVSHLKQFQTNVTTRRGRPCVILKGELREKAAWQLLKQLETFPASSYPIHLDIGDLEAIHWFAARILKAGVDHIMKSRGEIFLIQKRKKPKPFSLEYFPPILSFVEEGSDEV
ncbi:MAG: hypothetical protein NPIRA04_04430 [Nitrospirales bacterium]|nr:MAG: hypothetical protein NPIRA04_04430 [Nitrospirales bacterium]